MKIDGKKAELQAVSYCVLPRDTGDIVFKAKAVLNAEDFEKLCPAPIPPKITKRGGPTIENVEDPTYKEAMRARSADKMHWLILKSLQLPDGWEWETVNFADKDTWSNYITELNESGLTPYEISRVIDCALEANGLNQTKIDEAQKRFLATLEKA